ncbi:DNA-3-methyladenine glycosylase family protein [Actinoplanes couchii]|uniref:DNA-3-methyladenine glycosylase II n=1 Tax=Actinoplanes couchii TaxID=403638 RepID=A0ABQ3XU98_9ACTN|nr:DNA-3-methyladenine glycosylase 2 family protein [Actinoplanes couchii]MDR6318493.1 DNA-3-methyladenine glycosylase II [Actinoplanes couchii]GID62093.1 3-methyladenine DNA glycosylase [Actinoplanes couchii]
MTTEDLRRGVAELARREDRFAAVVRQYGFPPMWDRAPGFATLLHIMLEQQVSLASARATFGQLTAITGSLTAENVLRLDDARLRSAGLSRQKARYARAVATAVVDGSLDLDALPVLEDASVDAMLLAVTGIGPWTAAIYRLSALGRADAWPASDLAVVTAIADLWQLPAPPAPADTLARAEAWRPWRSVAARLLWQQYLGKRTRPHT